MATRIPIHLLSARLARLSTSTTEAREERVQAQEVGVIRSARLSQGEICSGRLGQQGSITATGGHSAALLPREPVEGVVGDAGQTVGHLGAVVAAREAGQSKVCSVTRNL